MIVCSFMFYNHVMGLFDFHLWVNVGLDIYCFLGLIIPTKMRMPIMISSDNEKSCSLIFIPPVYTYNKNK